VSVLWEKRGTRSLSTLAATCSSVYEVSWSSARAHLQSEAIRGNYDAIRCNRAPSSRVLRCNRAPSSRVLRRNPTHRHRLMSTRPMILMPLATRAPHWSSITCQSVAISGHQWPSVAIRGNQGHSPRSDLTCRGCAQAAE
jgi:hypothetical protein